MGQLTKFVKPGAYRIDSTSSSTILNVAWINPDGSKALIAYNGTGSTQPMTVNWGGESFTYNLPAATSATFTWGGTQSGSGGTPPPSGSGQIVSHEGSSLCIDDRSASTANGNPIQIYTCNGSSAQNWTVESNGTLQVLGKCMDVVGGSSSNGALIDLYDCNGTGAQVWQAQPNGELLNPQSGKCLDDTNFSTTPGTQLQIYSCADTANQQWTMP
jgi:glucosylceramidase